MTFADDLEYGKAGEARVLELLDAHRISAIPTAASRTHPTLQRQGFPTDGGFDVYLTILGERWDVKRKSCSFPNFTNREDFPERTVMLGRRDLVELQIATNLNGWIVLSADLGGGLVIETRRAIAANAFSVRAGLPGTGFEDRECVQVETTATCGFWWWLEETRRREQHRGQLALDFTSKGW